MKALVTHCTRNAGLTAMRALTRAGWSVLGADDRLLAFGLRSRCAMAPYELLPAEREPQVAVALLGLLDRTRPDVLVPLRNVKAVCQARNFVALRTRSLLPPPEAFEVVNDKVRLLKRCAALGIPVPRVFECDEATDHLRHSPGSQVVVKPCRDVGGGQSVHLVTDAGRLADVYRSVVAAHGAAVIAEYVPGPTANLRGAQLLFDSTSRLIAFFVLRKLRIWPPRVGVTVTGDSTHETELVERLLPLFQDLGWQGPADVDLKIDIRDGDAKLIEVNPRFSGALHFPVACGVNMPLLYCRAALGERLKEARYPAYRPGVRYLDTARWLAAVVAELRERDCRRAATLKHVWKELRAPRVKSIHEITDPAPVLAKLLLTLPVTRRPSS